MELTKRAIPFDQPIKITLLFLHFIGFSGWYGGILAGMKTSPLFSVVTGLSGFLLMGRELYKDGWVWLVATCCFANYFDLNFLIKLMFADYFKGGLWRLPFVFVRSVPWKLILHAPH